MQLLIDQLDVNSCAGEIEEYLARFSFCQDAHEDMSEKAATGAFLTVIGGPAFSLVSTLVFPKTLQEATLQEIKDALLHHFKPVNFEASERAKFNVLSRSPSDSFRNCVLQLQIQPARCNFGAELNNHLRDRLIAGINDAALQKRMLLEKGPTFSSLRMLCEKSEELDKAVEQPAVLLHKCANWRKHYKRGITISFRKVKEEAKHSESVPPSTYNCDNQQDSAKTIPPAYSLSRHAVMIRLYNASHTLRMQPLPVSGEDLQRESRIFLGSIMNSVKSGCQRKTKTLPEYFKHECPRCRRRERCQKS